MAVLQVILVVSVILLPPTLGAFTPGCSFSNDQCLYNVQLGHQGQCDTPGSAPVGTGGTESCCDTVQGNVNSLQGVVEVLTNQMKEVQSKLGLKQSNVDLLNTTANERDKLLQDLLEKQAELNNSQSNLADLVQRSADVINQLKEELANATRDLNNCKGVLGLKVHNQLPVTASGDVNQTLCTFEHGMCGFTQDTGDGGNWVLAQSSLSTYTGPREDHTYGSPKGHYMYIDPNQNPIQYSPRNKTMRLVSPVFAPAHDYCIRFWYNMYGNDVRSLKVYSMVGTGLGYPVWRSYGNQGQQWHMVEVSLDSEYTSHPFKIVFEGVTDAYRYSSSFSSLRNNRDDIAIDDVFTYNTSCHNLPSCPMGAITRKGTTSSCYTFHTAPETWYDSASACRGEGANSHLVSVNSKDEQDFLTNTIKQNAGLTAAGSYGWFTSGNDERSEGHFDWTDTGTPYVSQYSDWHPGQPNNVANDQDCLLLQYADSNFEWGDIDCDEKHPFICEVDLPVV